MEIKDLRKLYPILEIYKKNLPPSEYKILELWLCTFFKFQLDWMLDPAPLAACNKSRQIGISHTTAAVGVLWGVFHGETTTIISIGQLESGEVLEKSKGHTSVLEKLGSKFAKIKRDPANMLAYEHGGRIIALPSSGGRSFSGNVFLDEFAYQEFQDKVWDGAMGGTMHQGRKARVVSTPNGVGELFHNLITNPSANKGWSLHEIPITRAIADGMDVDLEKCWSLAHGDKDLFGQMFECKFLDSEGQYIPTYYVERNQSEDPSAPSGVSGINYGGLDIGSSNDPSVLWITKKVGNKRYTQEVKSCNPTTDAELDKFIKLAIDTFNCKKICIDKTGLGEMPAKRYEKMYPRIIEPIDFTLKSKETLATNIYSLLANDELTLPAGNKIKNEFCSIKRIKSDAGNIKYDAPRGKDGRGHADNFWACALSNLAANKSERISGIITSKTRRDYANRRGF